MATAKKKRNKDSGSNDSVIASRILQDIINNSSDTFRAFLQQQMGGGVQAQPLAGGGAERPLNLMPVQGPPAPAGYSPRLNMDNLPAPARPGAQPAQFDPAVPGVAMPTPPMLGGATPVQMPGAPRYFEDGSVQMPWDHPMPRWEPQSMSILDLLGIR